MGNCNTKACSWRVLPLRYLYLSIGLCVCAQSCPILCNPWTVARQAPLSMGSPRQESWSGEPFSHPEGLLDPGIKPEPPVSSALQADSLPSEPPEKSTKYIFACVTNDN